MPQIAKIDNWMNARDESDLRVVSVPLGSSGNWVGDIKPPGQRIERGIAKEFDNETFSLFLLFLRMISCIIDCGSEPP